MMPAGLMYVCNSRGRAAAHQVVEQLGRLVADLLVLDFDGAQRRGRHLGDHRLVRRGDQRHVFGDAESMTAAGVHDVTRGGVGQRDEQRDGRLPAGDPFVEQSLKAGPRSAAASNTAATPRRSGRFAPARPRRGETPPSSADGPVRPDSKGSRTRGSRVPPGVRRPAGRLRRNRETRRATSASRAN